MNALRLLIVADDELVRTGLAGLLAEEPELDVVGQIASHADPFALLDEFRPDVVLWDLGWDPSRLAETTAGLDGLGDLVEAAVPVVVLLPEESQAETIWQTGVRSLLLRTASAGELLAALNAAANALVVLDPTLAGELTATLTVRSDFPLDAFTPREEEVLALLAEGLTNKAIARHLQISEHTAKFHVTALMSKLGAQSRTEAVVRATRLGLIRL